MYSLRGFTGNTFRGSTLFLYYAGRTRQGTAGEDTGAVLTMSLAALRDVGVCPESMYPYVKSKVLDKPSNEIYAAANEHRIKGIKAVPMFKEAMIACLRDGQPFVFGFNLGSKFRKNVGVSGIFNKLEGDPIGSHAVCAVGYSSEKRAFLVANSWGTDWGYSGYFLFDEKMIADPKLCATFYQML
jgi:C1A family cysteine protease